MIRCFHKWFLFQIVRGTDKPFPLITTAVQAELGQLPYWSSLFNSSPHSSPRQGRISFQTLHTIADSAGERELHQRNAVLPLDFLFHNIQALAFSYGKAWLLNLERWRNRCLPPILSCFKIRSSQFTFQRIVHSWEYQLKMQRRQRGILSECRNVSFESFNI